MAKFQQEVPPPIFHAEHANKNQEFEWSFVQNNLSAPGTDSLKDKSMYQFQICKCWKETIQDR